MHISIYIYMNQSIIIYLYSCSYVRSISLHVPKFLYLFCVQVIHFSEASISTSNSYSICTFYIDIEQSEVSGNFHTVRVRNRIILLINVYTEITTIHTNFNWYAVLCGINQSYSSHVDQHRQVYGIYTSIFLYNYRIKLYNHHITIILNSKAQCNIL